MIPNKHKKFFKTGSAVGSKSLKRRLADDEEDDLYDLARLEEMLGLKGPDAEKNRRKLNKEFLEDGFDDDLLGLLDDLDDFMMPAKKKKKPSTTKDVAPVETDEESEKSEISADEGADETERGEVLTGMLNRLTEGNLEIIVEEMSEELLRRPDPEGFGDKVGEMLMSENGTTLTMTGVVCGLVVAMTKICGNAYGLGVLERLTDRKKGDLTTNSARFLGLSFSMGLVSVEVVEKAVSWMLEGAKMTDKRLDTLVTLLRFAGSRLKRDYPSLLESLVKSVVEEVRTKNAELMESSRRVRILVEEMEGFPKSSFSVMEHFEPVVSWLNRAEIGSRKIACKSQIKPDDLSERSFLFSPSSSNSVHSKSASKHVRKVSSSSDRITKLEEQADRLNLTSEVTKSLFIAIMGAVNIEDAELRISRVKAKYDDIYPMVIFCALRDAEPRSFYSELALRLAAQEIKRSDSANKKTPLREAIVKELYKCAKYKSAVLSNFASFIVEAGFKSGLVDFSVLRFSNFQSNPKLQVHLITPVLLAACSLPQAEQRRLSAGLVGKFQDCQLALALVMKEHVIPQAGSSSESLMAALLGM